MGKGRPPREILARRNDGKKPKPKPKDERDFSYTKWASSAVVAGSLVLAYLIPYLTLKPTIEIETPSSNPADAYELFSRPFVIKNNSALFSVYNVRASCGIVRVLYEQNAWNEHGLATQFVPPIPEFEAGQEHSVPCSDLMQWEKRRIQKRRGNTGTGLCAPVVLLGSHGNTARVPGNDRKRR